MVAVATIGVIAGYFKLGGAIVEKIINIGMLCAGIWFVYTGKKLEKDAPDKTVKILKPIKVSKFLVFCGIIVFVANLITLFAPKF